MSCVLFPSLLGDSSAPGAPVVLQCFSMATEGHPASPFTLSDTFFLSGTGSPHQELQPSILSSPFFIARFRSSFSFRRFPSTHKLLTSFRDSFTLATLPSPDSLSLDRNFAFATMSHLRSAPNLVRSFGMEQLVKKSRVNREVAAAKTVPRLQSFHQLPLLRPLRLAQLLSRIN